MMVHWVPFVHVTRLYQHKISQGGNFDAIVALCVCRPLCKEASVARLGKTTQFCAAHHLLQPLVALFGA